MLAASVTAILGLEWYERPIMVVNWLESPLKEGNSDLRHENQDADTRPNQTRVAREVDPARQHSKSVPIGLMR